MKSLIVSTLSALLLLSCTSLFAQNKTTLYYDENGKGLDTKRNAAFYRVVNFDANNKPTGTVEDFYMNAKPYAKGEALYIDKLDNSKSRWTGTLIKYNEKGRLIEQKSFDLDGRPDGKQFVFDAEGRKIQEDEYDHGNPTKNYYTVYDKANAETKYSYLTHLPVTLATSDKKLAPFTDRKTIYQNGDPVWFYTAGNIGVAVKMSTKQTYGDFYEAYVTIENGTDKQFNFDPAEITVLLEKDGKPADGEILSYNIYTTRVNHKQRYSPGYNAYAKDVEANPAGYSGVAKSLNTLPADTTQRIYTISQNLDGGYLKINTLLPGSRLVGFINIKYRKADHMILNVPVNGLVCQFVW